jgi:hypothetical protein
MGQIHHHLILFNCIAIDHPEEFLEYIRISAPASFIPTICAMVDTRYHKKPKAVWT